jgi:GYF domain 2
MSILIWKDGQQLGPFTDSELLEQVRSGKVAWNDLAWTEGYSDWKPLSEIARIDFQPPPPPVARVLPTEDKSAVPKDKSRPAKTLANTVLEHAATTAGLTQKQAYRKKLEFVDLRQADGRIGQKAFESGLLLPGHEAITSQLRELSAEIAALKVTKVNNPVSLADKTRATAQAAANAATIEALTFKQNQLFRELGAAFRRSRQVEESLAAEKDAGKLIFQKIQALDLEIENLGSRTYWWARRPLWVVAGLLTAAGVWIAVSLISSVSNQWETDRQKERIKAQFDAYQQGAAALVDTLKRRQADSAAAAEDQMRQAQRAREEALRQQKEQNEEMSRQAQHAIAEEQSRKQQATAEQPTGRNETQRPDQAAAEVRQKTKREQLAKIAIASPFN